MRLMKEVCGSMHGKLIVISGVFASVFVVFGLAALSTLHTAKVHGPHYEEVVRNKDLLADVLPPKSYIVEAYLSAQLMVVADDEEKLEELIQEYELLKDEYAAHQAHWRSTLNEGPIKTEVTETSREPAEQLFSVIDNQLIPAVKKRDRDVVSDLVHDVLPPLFAKHRGSVERIAVQAGKMSALTENEVSNLIDSRERLMVAGGFFFLIGFVAFTWRLTNGIKSQEDEMARVNSMMEQAPINVMFADTDRIVRYLNPASVRTLHALREHLPSSADEILEHSIDRFYVHQESQRPFLSDPDALPLRTQMELGSETIEMFVSPVYSSSHKYMGAMITWEVITERLAIERQIAERAEEDRRISAETNAKVDVVLDVVNCVAEGDFSRDVPDLGDDAVGKVGQALNAAIQAIRTTLGDVRNVASTVADAAQQMTSASGEIATGAQQQASSLEETASNLEEITTKVKQNTGNAQHARELATSSRDVAEKGDMVVGEAVDAMNAINESSNKIAEIITTIDEIAFQTNLLALNAAVEAARAGEQGRGFAVVASEVRCLAQRSAAAAKEIKALIQDSSARVENGTQLVDRSGETLQEIVESVKQVTNIVAEIASASNEQLSGIEQVNRAVAEMDRVTQSNANQTEQMSGTSCSLLSHAERLNAMVAQFHLGASDEGSTHQANVSLRDREERRAEPAVQGPSSYRVPALAAAAPANTDRTGDEFFEEF